MLFPSVKIQQQYWTLEKCHKWIHKANIEELFDFYQFLLLQIPFHVNSGKKFTKLALINAQNLIRQLVYVWSGHTFSSSTKLWEQYFTIFPYGSKTSNCKKLEKYCIDQIKIDKTQFYQSLFTSHLNYLHTNSKSRETIHVIEPTWLKWNVPQFWFESIWYLSLQKAFNIQNMKINTFYSSLNSKFKINFKSYVNKLPLNALKGDLILLYQLKNKIISKSKKEIFIVFVQQRNKFKFKPFLSIESLNSSYTIKDVFIYKEVVLPFTEIIYEEYIHQDKEMQNFLLKFFPKELMFLIYYYI